VFETGFTLRAIFHRLPNGNSGWNGRLCTSSFIVGHAIVLVQGTVVWSDQRFHVAIASTVYYIRGRGPIRQADGASVSRSLDGEFGYRELRKGEFYVSV
jgi:hypothetical protein